MMIGYVIGQIIGWAFVLLMLSSAIYVGYEMCKTLRNINKILDEVRSQNERKEQES